MGIIYDKKPNPNSAWLYQKLKEANSKPVANYDATSDPRMSDNGAERLIAQGYDVVHSPKELMFHETMEESPYDNSPYSQQTLELLKQGNDANTVMGDMASGYYSKYEPGLYEWYVRKMNQFLDYCNGVK